MIWKILFQILAVLLALLTASLDYIWHDKRTVKFKRTRIALFLCSLVLLAVSIIVIVQDQYQNEQEIKALTSRLDRITNELTGGDSFCYVQYAFPVDSNNTILLWLINDGDYPLYDTQIRMVDLYKFNNLLWKIPMSLDEIKKAETLIPLGIVGPHSVMELGTVQTPVDQHSYGINVWIHTRYKEFVEEARFRRIEGRWRLAYRLFEQTNQGQKLIFEKIPNEFVTGSPPQNIWEFPTPTK